MAALLCCSVGEGRRNERTEEVSNYETDRLRSNRARVNPELTRTDRDRQRFGFSPLSLSLFSVLGGAKSTTRTTTTAIINGGVSEYGSGSRVFSHY